MKKNFWILSLVLVFAMFLAACGGNNNDATTDPDENENQGAEENDDNNANEDNDNGDNENEGASDEPQYGGDIIIGSTGAPTLFNGLYSNDASSSDIEGMIFDGLVGSDLEFNPVTDNGLAESVD